MPMVEVVKGFKESPVVLMTHPNGGPAEVPAKLVARAIERGYKKGYMEPPEITKRRAENKVDFKAKYEALVAETEGKKPGRPPKS